MRTHSDRTDAEHAVVPQLVKNRFLHQLHLALVTVLAELSGARRLLRESSMDHPYVRNQQRVLRSEVVADKPF